MGTLIIKKKLTAIIQKGISFELSQDKLLVKGDLDRLSDEDKSFLRSSKEAIISLIKNQTQEVPSIEKVKGTDAKPLSFSQQSLWLLDRINNGSDHYNLSSAFKLKGALDYNALNQTFLTIVQRHESLRSYFEVSATGEPIQKVQEVNAFEVVIDDLVNTQEDQETIIKKSISQEAKRVFDLTKDLLLSVRLLKLAENEHIIMVTMHHIASDGWSMGVFVNEFNTLYSCFTKGEANPLPDLDIQYSDYASWQRNWLQGEVMDDHANYWKNQLADLPVLHNLPVDRPRPVEQKFNGDIYNSYIDKKNLDSLTKFCQGESASLFMGIHAAFSSLLARYSNETDIVVGSPIANREKAEVADLIGFFMNLLVLRSDLSDKPSFRQLLQQSKKMLTEAYAYQQMPFEKLVEVLKVKRNLSHNSLFQVLLTLQNNQQGEFAASDLTMESLDYISKNAKYDLTLDITETSEGLYLDWEYNTDLFDESTIAGMAEHFNTLLEVLLANPDENVFKTNIIGDRESKELYKFLEGEKVELSIEDDTMRRFEKNVNEKSNEIAVICNDVSYTYKELGSKINNVARFLKKQGVQSGDKVGMCLLRSVDMVATIFACFKVGAAYIPLDPVYPKERLNQIINDAQPKCIVTLNALKKLYLSEVSEKTVVCLDGLKSRKNSKNIVSDCNEENVAYIIFTSGTTGRPKGIEITHSNLNNLLKGFDNSFENNDQQRWLAQTSMNFDISVLELIWTISRGQTIVLQQSNPFKLLASDRQNPAKKLDFSVMFFGADKSTEQKYDLLLETAKFADKNNFTAIWTPERHFGEFGGAFPSPAVLSSALSVLTKNISIRSGSVVLPLHDPIRVAEEWSLIDNLSKGRVGLSIASGWQPDDFVFGGTDYKNRHQEMRGKIAELKDLWAGNGIVRTNGVNKDFEIKIRPQPIQKELPLWITAAGSPETFKYAGSIGANLLTHMLGQSMEKLADNIAIYHASLREHGFKVEDKKVSLMLHTYIDSSEQLALGISERPFKDYLGSSIKLMEPLAKELGIDVKTQTEELIDLAYQRFSKENTLIGSPESCQKMLYNIQDIGVTEVACLVDFGVENDKVLSGLGKIVEAKDLYNSYNEFISLLNTDNQKTELDLIDEYDVTHVQMTPSQSKLVLNLYNQTKNKSLSSVQNWFVGGEALNQEVIKGLSEISNARFYNMYGPTETTVWSAWREVNGEDIRIGEPIINTDLLLLNEFDQQVPIGVVGELFIGGRGLAKSYHDNADLTKERFRTINNPHFGNAKFYKTGDLMKLNADGTFEYVGRSDNQVKVNGYRIELEEIEKTISKISEIKDCKVVPIVDNNTTFLAAYIVKEESEDATPINEGFIKDFLKISLPDYMVPQDMNFVSIIPLMGNGKVDMVKLKEIRSQKPTSIALPELTDKTQLTIYKIWCEILKKEEILHDISYFEAGGNSIEMVLLHEKLQKEFNVEFSLVDLFRNPTLVQQAKLIENADSSSNENLNIPKAPVSENGYPLSSSQTRLWILSQIKESSISYNTPFFVMVDELYDVPLFEKAIKATIDRHEILRTVFRTNEENEVRQWVLPQEEMNLQFDYRDFSDRENSEEQALALVEEDYYLPFDLANGPLVRTKLIKIEGGRGLFYFNIHHIVSDGWSMDILTKDILEFYFAFVGNRSPKLSTLNVQYKDYAIWQQQELSSATQAENKEYWFSKLKGDLPVFELPCSKERPQVKTNNGNKYSLHITNDQIKKLRDFVGAHEGTLFMGLMAVLKVLVHKYTNQKDLIIGTPIAGRDHADLKDQIGFYVNTLAIRSSIDERSNFKNYFDQVKDTIIESYDHQRYPFDSLVEDLQLQRDPSRSAIFDVMMVLQNAVDSTIEVEFPKVFNTTKIELNTTSKFDLLFALGEFNDGVLLQLEYNSDIYDTELIYQMVAHFVNLMERLPSRSEDLLSEVSYLTSSDTKKLASFNDTAFDTRQETVIKLFTEQVKDTPDATALLFGNDKLTYREVDRKTNRLARMLIVDYNISPGDMIGVVLPRSIDSVIAMIAVLKTGACYVPIDYQYPETRINYICKDANLKLVISEKELIGYVEDLSIDTVLIDEKVLSEYAFSLVDYSSLNDAAFVIYTSGSTGVPKGVIQTHKMLSNLIEWDINNSGIETGLRYLQYASFSFDASLHDVFFSLCSSGSIYITSEEERLDYTVLKDIILSNAVEVLSFPYSAMINFFQQHAVPDFSEHSIKHIVSTAEQLYVKGNLRSFLEAYPEVSLHNHYGPSETHVVTSYTMSFGDGNLVYRPSIGKPINNTKIHILDENLYPVAIGVKGELYIGGWNLAKGYMNLPDQTKARFIKDPKNSRNLLYKTGDIGYWTNDGTIEYIGREDKQIKIRGYRVELDEVANNLLKMDEVKDAVVLMKTISSEDFLCAYIVADPALDMREVRKDLEGLLPSYMIPNFFIRLDELPLTSNGKIAKRMLPSPLSKEAMIQEEYVAPRDEVEEGLVAIWEELLGIEKIGVTESFFDLGGHSLKLIMLINSYRKAFNVELNLKDLFVLVSIEKHAELIGIQNLLKTQESKSTRHFETETITF